LQKKAQAKANVTPMAVFLLRGSVAICPNKVRTLLRRNREIEEVSEERIETICSYHRLEKVMAAKKKSHPYEETVIDIYPIYNLGCKRESL
jgi:hypothetical protein